MEEKMFDFSNKEMVANKLQKLLNSNIPKMSLEKLLERGYSHLKPFIEDATEAEINECEEYLLKYCEEGYNGNKDIFSDEKCCFYWGLNHGEMVTNDNGLARTTYHYLTLAGKKHKVELLLQYHPSCYFIEE